jgi:hypothetical protein
MNWNIAEFRNKNEWRGWAWRRLSPTTSIWPGPILYLVGPSDVDRAVATALGVPPEILVATDVNRENVDQVRKQHGLGLRGDIVDAVRTWPGDWYLSGVHADFCGGLNGGARHLLRALVHRTAMPLDRGRGRTIKVIVNMQRGREPADFGNVRASVGTNHRGVLWWLLLRGAYTEAGARDPMHGLGAEFASYRGRRVTMDSVAVRLKWSTDPDELDRYWTAKGKPCRSPGGSRRDMARKLAALRALWTRMGLAE